MSSDGVVETTRTEVSVEEVTERRYECAVCEMVYDADDILTVGLDRERVDTSSNPFTDGTQPRAERYLCEHCVGGLFDYDANADSTLSEASTPAGTTPVDVVAAVGAATLVIVVAVIAATLPVALSGGPVALVPVAGICAAVAFVVGVLMG